MKGRKCFGFEYMWGRWEVGSERSGRHCVARVLGNVICVWVTKFELQVCVMCIIVWEIETVMQIFDRWLFTLHIYWWRIILFPFRFMNMVKLFKKAFWKFSLDIKIACYLDVKVHFSSSWKEEESWIQA